MIECDTIDGLTPRGFSEAAAAKFLGVSTSKLNRLVNRKRLAVRNASGTRLWDRDDLTDLLRNGEGLVYFIAAGAFVKIGFSVNVESRIRELQVGCPLPLRLIGTIPGFTEDEIELHARFAGLRVQGEWFLAKGKLKRFLATEFPACPRIA